jgi:hypothetical protein
VAFEMNLIFGGQWGNILFGGQWKVLSLVALEGSKFGGPWNVPCLVAFGRKRRNIFFISSIFHPIRFYFKKIPLILRFCFTMVLDYYFSFFIPFP